MSLLKTQGEVERQPMFDHDEMIAFAAHYDDTHQPYRPILISRDLFQEMGCPAKLHITMERAD